MYKQLLSSMFFKTILLTLVLPILTQAQITITDQDILNMLGTVIEAEIDTSATVSVNVGSSGENQIWDFRPTSIDGFQISIEYITRDGTPFASDFPGANFVQKSAYNEDGLDAEIYTYHTVSSQEFKHLGNGIISNGFKLLQSGGEDDAPLPLSYGSQWSTVVADTLFIVDSFYQVTKTTSDNTVDGWGTLKLPVVWLKKFHPESGQQVITR